MPELKSIKCYWDKSGKGNYNEQDMWEGQFVVYEDGWFEGVEAEPNMPYDKDRFIFGVFHQDKVIELFKISPLSVSYPVAFHSINVGDNYDGNFGVVSFSGETFYGNCRIVIDDVKENVDEQIKSVQERSEHVKVEFHPSLAAYYNNYLEIRNFLTQIVLRNYLSSVFIDLSETTHNLDLSCDHTVDGNSLDVAKQLVKAKKCDLSFLDEEEYPF